MAAMNILFGDVHIWHSYQVPCVVHACKGEFGSVPHLSNYVYFFIQLVYLLYISEKSELIIFIFGRVLRYHVSLMHVK